eukprot:13220811-Heterocapsa_arctica.AAC.1
MDVADVRCDVLVGQGPDEDSSRFLPLHGCPCDQGSVEVDDLSSKCGRRGGSSRVPSDVLEHGSGVSAAQVFPCHTDGWAQEAEVLRACFTVAA